MVRPSGLGKMHQLCGDQMDSVIEELTGGLGSAGCSQVDLDAVRRADAER